MQKINYNESISLNNPISELILINIDEKLMQTKESDSIKVSGKINISGEANTNKGKENFLHSIDVDILLGKEQLINDEAFISVDDFDYVLDNNKININLIIKIDGLKEIEPYFPPQEDQENIEIINILDDRQLNKEIIDSNHNIEAPKEINTLKLKEELILEPTSSEKEIEKNSLLKQLFKRKKSSTDSCYLFHVVKNETNYEEVAKLYNCDETLLRKINQNATIYPGKLLLIPKTL